MESGKWGGKDEVKSKKNKFKNIKNRSHDTIYIFKNYFVTVFSVFSFSNNKFNLNRPKKGYGVVGVWDMLERKQMKRENGIGEVGGKDVVKSNEGKSKKANV